MSQIPQRTDASNKGKPPPPLKNFSKSCAVLMGGPSGPAIAIGQSLGEQSKISAELLVVRRKNKAQFMAFTLSFPLPDNPTILEQSGFGVRYYCDLATGRVLPTKCHRLVIRFPYGGFETFVEAAPPTLLARFPNSRQAKNGTATLVSVHLKDGFQVELDGFGLPYANPEDTEVEGWVNNNKPILQGYTLLDILQQRNFNLLVDYQPEEVGKNWRVETIPPPHQFPYGTEHRWDIKHLKGLLANAKSKESFLPSYSFDDDDAHVTVCTQIHVQDFMWLHDAALAIAEYRFLAYFVPANPSNPDKCTHSFAIVPLNEIFKAKFADAWRRLVKTMPFNLYFFEDADERAPCADWDSIIIDEPGTIKALQDHPLSKHDLVLYVRHASLQMDEREPDHKVKTFQDRGEANRALKQANAN